ncbi:cytochrome P450 [Nonomuraea sp. KC401]|uniref:cytochrome P450 n=1 Tax=unclassified Nonomuraea TaxID=2593643 RepID=UPI0010FCDECA|nr:MULTISPECIES: cytochrome P450 [unclassified Nonomuraea]NBE91753.1 cytochrome P450 [Nonomuraea sp. K271]TLF86360.1 cytochrome P450 [Nonomuraea sp. KC401]
MLKRKWSLMTVSADIRSQKVRVDMFGKDFLNNPYPDYVRLREEEPVHWDNRLNGWVITRHSDVYAAHLDPETFSSHRLGAMVSNKVGPTSSDEMKRFMDLAPEWMLFRDPPDHTRIRRLLNREFRARDMRALRPAIEEIATEVIRRAAGKGEFDLVKDFAYQLPGRVLATMYGLPSAEGTRLTDWWYEIRHMQRVFLGADPTQVAPSGSPTAEAFSQMTPYLAELIGDRRSRPKDDLVTRVIAIAERGEEEALGLSEQEMFAHLLLLPLASFGTTMDLIGNGVLGLLGQRDQWDLLKDEPELIPSAVEEVLRYDASVQLTHRLVTRDIEVAGQPIAGGELVYLVRGAANRDPERWPAPDRIDVRRHDSGHVGFGVGIHRCLGAGLAQVITAAALKVLTQCVPGLSPVPDRPHRWKADTPQFRGLAEFPVRAER